MYTKLKSLFFTLVLFSSVLGITMPIIVQAGGAFRGAQTEVNTFAQTAQVNTATSDPKTVAANFIKAVLAFLGIIFLILVLFAGFLWMTAAGKEDQVEKAKGIIGRAVIGLAVVVLAYALTTFVFDILLKAVG